MASSGDDGGGEEEALARAFKRARPDVAAGGQRLGLKMAMASVLGPEVGGPMLGPFALLARVGAGGMGVVYRARDTRSGETVAIKVLKDLRGHERFAREMTVLRRVQHPRVVRYLDHGAAPDGTLYLAMEWIAGGDLAARVARGPLSVHEALRLGRDLAEALAAAHAVGVVHRDVKPHNVLLVDGRLDEPRLIDFGLANAARTSRPGRRLTATGDLMGSASYFAPEQLEGKVGFATDVYGLAATLYTCLAGVPPFHGLPWAALLAAVLREAPAPLVAQVPAVPAALDTLISRMLAKDPRSRPPDMQSVAAALASIAQTLG